jgi:hypothetical protein
MDLPTVAADAETQPSLFTFEVALIIIPPSLAKALWWLALCRWACYGGATVDAVFQLVEMGMKRPSSTSLGTQWGWEQQAT